MSFLEIVLFFEIHILSNHNQTVKMSDESKTCNEKNIVNTLSQYRADGV